MLRCSALSATFDGKQHLLSLPVVNSIDYVLRFLKKLCRSLHCENLFSDEPITQHTSYQSDGTSKCLRLSDASFCADVSAFSELIQSLILILAETSMAEDYHLDQSDGKRYSVDLGDCAFSSISSSYSSKTSYGFRSSQQFSNGSASMNMCRQPSTSPNTFPESNRTGGKQVETAFVFISLSYKLKLLYNFYFFILGYSAPSESQESKAPPNKDPSTWSVEDVVWFIRDADPQALGPHADIFRKHVSLFSNVLCFMPTSGLLTLTSPSSSLRRSTGTPCCS